MLGRKWTVVGTVAIGALLASCGSGAVTESEGELSTVAITSYGTSTASYAEMAAVAEAVQQTEGTSFRIIPSDTGVGRLKPLMEGTAQFARTGDEYWFAFEGTHEFATPEWGPQPLRLIWTPVVVTAFATTDKTGIVSAEDLSGKVVPDITANPSANTKIDALLASAGLTREDTRPTEVGYGDQPGALKNGQTDLILFGTGAASLAEIEMNTNIEWLELDPEDPALEEALAEYSPAVEVRPFSDAPGQEEGESDNGLYYPLPVVAVADTTDDYAYEMTRMIVENFDEYKDTTTTIPLWSKDEVPLVPTVVPFHDGAIRYLEENDLWSAEAQEKQDELLEREKTLAEGWDEVVQEADGGDLGAAWDEWRENNL